MENAASLRRHGLPLVCIKRIFHIQIFILESFGTKSTLQMEIV